MHFEVPRERVSQKLDEVLTELTRHARLPGFRKGKAPKDLVRSAHGKTAQEEMIKNLVPEAYQEGIRSEQLDPIDYPAIDQVEVGEGVLKFRATIDLRPEVEVKSYRGIKVAKKSSEVTDEELGKTLDYFKKGRGMDEKAELDDAFARGMGFPGMEEFKKAIRRNLEADKERQNKADVEGQIIEQLLKNSKLDVPRSLVERQFEGRVEDLRNRLKQYGAKPDDIKAREQESVKDLQAAAEKDVRLFLILQKIGQQENIDSQKGESLAAKVMEFLLKEAKWEDAK